jgi:hypothetical protein
MLRMRGSLRSAITLVAAGAILFALVCPLAPTPTATSKGKHVQFGLTILSAGIALTVITVSSSSTVYAYVTGLARDLPDVIDLTCARLC